MKIKEILRKQGKLYKNLTSNKTIQKCNETIEPVVPYQNHWISKQEYKVMRELENLLKEKPVVVDNPTKEFFFSKKEFEISINKNQITYLRIVGIGLKRIPKQINNLQNLQELYLDNNEIQEIRYLDNLTNLEELFLHDNRISEIKNLGNLTNLQLLELSFNKITEISNLDNLKNLRYLNLSYNKIEEIKGLDNLQNLQTLILHSNQVVRIKSLDNLTNLEYLGLESNPIRTIDEVREKIRELGKKGVVKSF